MGITDFTAFFDSIDATCKGYITAGQLHKFYESVYLSTISIDHVEAAAVRICGPGSTGHITKSYFLDVLEELERRRSIEDQSYWDFQALDYNGSNRISLKDALLLFREFHGEMFSLYTWNKFLKTRDEPDSGVYFDEIRYWLCDYPSGEPATEEQITQEEDRLEYKQTKYELSEIDSFGQLLDSEKEKEEYLDETHYQANRKHNKWKKQGLEAMLFDDGLDVEDTETQLRPQNTVTMSDLTNAIELKYDQLREKLLMEMATLSAALEGEKPEIFQQLSRQERQLRREGKLEHEVSSLSGSNMFLSGTLPSLMGYVRMAEKTFRDEMADLEKSLRQQGKSEAEIGQSIELECQKKLDGNRTCGATLVRLQQRYKEEKDSLLSFLRSGSGQTSMLMMSEYNRLSRQQHMLADEGDFVSAAVAVGLAERPQDYKSNRKLDIDRSRSENLANLRLQNKKGRKQMKTSGDVIDIEELTDKGLVDLQNELTVQLVRKQLYEREGFINMLQGPDSLSYKTAAKKLDTEQRAKQLKTLRNKHRSWKGSSSADNSVLFKILSEATALYCETRMLELQQGSTRLTDVEVIQCVLADLQQRHEVEYEEKLKDIVSQATTHGLIQLIKKENISQIQENFDNIAYVVLGTIEVGEEDKEYVAVLDEKYHTLREKVFIMALKDQHGTEWKRFNEEEKKREIVMKRKEEKKLRGQGQYEEMEELVGPKSKLLPTLRRLIGEEKPEFEDRFKKQKLSGAVQDELSHTSVKSVNVLADLIPRYDNEQEAMLLWLQSKDAKSLPLKTKRLLILHLKLEVIAAKMEDDFEVATLRLGLAERILASIHGRHPSDINRQTQLARKRIQLRTRKLLQKESTDKKTEKHSIPSAGDLTGWQVSYVREMMHRHDDEREQLLHYLQDDNLEDLTEAAAMMSDEDRKIRLAELHSKRRKLDLRNPDDREEMISIIEEAVAIRTICKKLEMEQLSRKPVTMEEVTVTLVTEIQEEQDRELAYVLEMIVDLEEEDLKQRLTDEVKAREQQSLKNVFVVLLQSEGKSHGHEMLKALELKFENLQECLLVTCLSIKSGRHAWDKMSAKEKQQKISAMRNNVKELLNSGADNIGLLDAVGDGALEETVNSIMGMTKSQFLLKYRGQGNEDEDVQETSESQSQNKISPVIQLLKRLDEEKANLHKRLKGLEEDYLGEKEQEIHLVRLRNEATFCSQEDKFMFVAIHVGLVERQTETGKPCLQGDRTRYIKLAKHKMEIITTSPKQKDVKDNVLKGKDKVTHMEGVTDSIRRKHDNELQIFSKLLNVPVDQMTKDEVMSLSQQQRKDRLSSLKSDRLSLPLDNWNAQETLIREGIILKREIYRHRLNQNQKEYVTDSIVNEMLFADLLLQQNCDMEKAYTSFKDMNEDDLSILQQKAIQDRKSNLVENIVEVVFSLHTMDEDSETELLEALDGKFDALRDKLLAEALMKQLGETEWNRLSELERQKKLTELKLKERQLRREGKLDELASILGDALDNQETLKKLLGDSKEEHERKMRERLERRKQRLAQGLTEEECDRLEEEDIAKEEEEEKKRHKNILLELDHQYEKEKEELLRRLRNENDQHIKERNRQIEVMKLKKQERKARKEDKFNSAALVIGLAEENEKRIQELQDEERKRQEKLARERIEAARRRKKGGQPSEEEEENLNIDTEDRTALQEALSTAIDRRHQRERDILIEVLDDGCDTPSHNEARQVSQEERDEKLAELRERRKLWRQNKNRDKKDQIEIFNESVGYQLETQLYKAQAEGQTKDLDEVKVQILTDLQQRQDDENRRLLSNLEEEDIDTLQQMMKAESMNRDEGCHENVSHVLLGDSGFTKSKEDKDEHDVVQALEEKYDALREKILEATLIDEIGEDEWNKLSDKEKQKRLVEMKMKEKKLRKDGKLKEAADMFKGLLKNSEALDKILGDEIADEEEDPVERQKKKDKLKEEREEQGLSVDDDTLDQILDEEAKEEAKKKRKNILENLQTMFDDEKAALLATLKGQKDRADQERQRQIAIAKLRRDKKRLEKEEKLDSAALILSMAKQADDKQKQNIAADRERQIALAKERLEARRKKRMSPQNLEQNLMDDNEADKLKDVQNIQNGTLKHVAIFDAVEKRQEDERDMMMELFLMAKNDQSLTKEASKKSPEELKMELSKLQQDHTKWRNKSQQMAVNTSVESLSPKECNVYFKQVSDSRQEQSTLLKQTLVYRLELEERNIKTQKPDLSPEDISKELQVSLLADLQEKQTSETNVIQNLIKQQDDEGLDKLKRVQRMATREGWYDSLAGMLYQISHGEGMDDEDAETIDRMRRDMELKLQEEKEELVNQARRAARLGEDIDMEAELRNIENQMEAKRKVMEQNLERQKQKMQEKIQAKKRASMDKEEEEITAMQLVLLAETQKQQTTKQMESEKGRQGSLLQQRLEERKKARRQSMKEEEERPSRPSSMDSNTPSPAFGLSREKTVLNVEVSDDQKKELFSKLVREQTNLHSKITAQQKQQEEMLQRRLDQRKGKLQTEAAQLFDIGERQKNKLQRSKKEEKERQMLEIKEKVSRAKMGRERSRSPNISTLTEEGSKKK